jgi:hypothetical protein
MHILDEIQIVVPEPHFDYLLIVFAMLDHALCMLDFDFNDFMLSFKGGRFFGLGFL